MKESSVVQNGKAQIQALLDLRGCVRKKGGSGALSFLFPGCPSSPHCVWRGREVTHGRHAVPSLRLVSPAIPINFTPARPDSLVLAVVIREARKPRFGAYDVCL